VSEGGGRPVRILLCDDHRLLGEAFATALRTHGYEVVAVTVTPEAGYRAVLEHDPDVCVLDLYFPDGSGLEAAVKITSSGRPCKVLMLSACSDPDLINAALAAGAAGFVLKDESIGGILRALDRLAAGEVAVDPALQRAAISTRTASRRTESERLRFLTPREREALRRLAEGESTKEIARAMHVAHSTARTHVQNVLTKLGVRSRLQAAALVAKEGLSGELETLIPRPRYATADDLSDRARRSSVPSPRGVAEDHSWLEGATWGSRALAE
jgi:two-component system, NarL family, nitrate/nitrite response regulator NarL